MDSAEEQPTLHETLNLLHQGKCRYAAMDSIQEQCLHRPAASRTTAKQRTIKVSSIVDVICRYASENGLDQDALRDIVQLASVKTSLDQTTITTLIKNLYPSQKVPSDGVITIIAGQDVVSTVAANCVMTRTAVGVFDQRSDITIVLKRVKHLGTGIMAVAEIGALEVAVHIEVRPTAWCQVDR